MSDAERTEGQLHLAVITGLVARISTAINALEDLGFSVWITFLLALLPKLVDLAGSNRFDRDRAGCQVQDVEGTFALG